LEYNDQSCAQDDQSCAQDDQSCGQDDQSCGQDDQSCGQDDQSCGQDDQSCGQDDQSCGQDNESPEEVRLCNKNVLFCSIFKSQTVLIEFLLMLSIYTQHVTTNNSVHKYVNKISRNGAFYF
jgi:hypothetical protein